jgi:hypothetical protein
LLGYNLISIEDRHNKNIRMAITFKYLDEMYSFD